MNISPLQRLRKRLLEGARDRLFVAKYDQTIRFNIIIADRPDETIAVVQATCPTPVGSTHLPSCCTQDPRVDCLKPSSRSTTN